MRLNPFSALLAGALTAAACSNQPRIGDVTTIQPNLSVTASRQEADADAAGRRADSIAKAMNSQGSDYARQALTTCAPDICSAINRSELAIGMTRAGALTVTQSTPEGWIERGGADFGTMTPKDRSIKDRVAEVALLSFRDGRLVSYTYRETTGLRSIEAPADATMDGRRHAQATSLLEQGDQMLAAGYADNALAKYDQADVMEPNTPATTLRIAKLLDQQMRPLEALMRYQKFLHEMDIERIKANGSANAELAAAVVAAQARVVHLVETTNKKP